MTFLQAVPTSEWGPCEVETLVSEAFVLSTLYQGSQAHLTHVESTRDAAHDPQELGGYLQ